jgi:hypothetical protein
MNTFSTYAKEYISDNGFTVKHIIKLIKEIIIEALKYEFIISSDLNINKNYISDSIISEQLKLYNLSKFSYIEDNFGFKIYVQYLF